MPTLLPPTREQAPERAAEVATIERLTRILLVEDEPLTAEVFAKALTRDGHQVDVARDGLQALRRLRHGVPTVIVLNMNLPAVSGADVVRQLRADGHDRIPVVIVSGSSPEMSSLDAAQLQPGTWVEKPVKPRDLVRIVRQFVPDAMD